MSTVLTARIPRLENGDELTREEFERRYEAMPGVKKAELIEGVVYMPSPVRFDLHGAQHVTLVTLFGYYRFRTPGVGVGDNGTVRLDEMNEPQPDVALFILPDFGGAIHLVEGYVEGSPELLAEISASTVSIDLHKKLRAYERNGVKEYLVWRTEDNALDWFVHDGQQFQRTEPGSDGVLRSRVFPGLWIAVASLFKDDGPTLLATLDRGLASPEHGAFIVQLREAADRIQAR